eukprot:m.63125 g.63125  ORF g.63125 m.63125 type:complete len:366 (+) comp35145_c2_seq8:34-1131(+)
MESSAANKDEASRCLDIAKTALAQENRGKALRFLRKSFQLFPTKECEEMLNNVQNSRKKSPKPQKNGPTLRNRRKKEDETIDGKSEENDEKNYTEDQVSLVKKVLSCKNYYEILGVEKDANEADLKKKYRKLALQLHPDKNQAPGASEAFKAVGKAFGVLSDSDKRKQYDAFGDEDQLERPTRHYYRDDDIDVDQLFHMFFGGSPFGRDLYMQRRPRGHSHHRHHHHHVEERIAEVPLSLLPLLGMLLLLVFSTTILSWKSHPEFSLHRTRLHTVQRTTESFKHPIKFFVEKSFDSKYGGSVKKIEKQVRREYLDLVEERCYFERQQQNQDMAIARYHGDKERERKAAGRDLRNCNEYFKVRDGG